MATRLAHSRKCLAWIVENTPIEYREGADATNAVESFRFGEVLVPHIETRDHWRYVALEVEEPKFATAVVLFRRLATLRFSFRTSSISR